MNTLVTFILLIAAASAQFFPGFPFQGFPPEDLTAASLGGAPVGLYSKTHPNGPFGGPFGGPFNGYSSDITSASLGGAKVGLYGKEHPQQGFPGFPGFFPRPVIPVRQPPKRY